MAQPRSALPGSVPAAIAWYNGAVQRPRPVAESENRLARFNADRERILSLVEQRIYDRCVEAARNGGEQARLEYVLNDIAYQEMQRLGGRKEGRDYRRWRDVANRLGDMSEGDKQDTLRQLIHRYALDIVGNFDPRVYRFASGVIPHFFGVAFQPLSVTRGLRGARTLAERVRVEGELDVVRACCERGTLIVAPTHSSNMDSIVLGYALQQAGLPPVTYGAGKNLFTNPLISFFMYNLGAYRVDRRLRFQLYKDILKEYSTVILERGYHSLFFPGGTRSRSNLVESRLKLGLLGTALGAYQNRLRSAHNARPFYVVPATINYHLVLEAETLIEDHLAEVGKSRYIIDDDEFTRIGRLNDFLRRTLALDESVVIRLGRPLDVFGHQVDDRGESLDRRGRLVDPSTYVRGADGEVVADAQRDSVYTRLLGEQLATAFRRETIFMTTHLVSRALFDALARRAGTTDIYRLLRLGKAEAMVAVDDVCRGVDAVRDALLRDPSGGMVPGKVRDMTTLEVVDDGLRALGEYHTTPVARRTGQTVRIDDMRLLFYYRNRSAHVELDGAGEEGGA